MNIRQVKECYNLEKLLDYLDHQPDRKSRGSDLWYCSPFRPEEETPSFHIDTTHDIWKDFGLHGRSGGDMIFFVQRLLEEQGRLHGISDVLEWFEKLPATPIAAHHPKRTAEAPMSKTEPLQLLSARPIFTQALFDYLEERGIDSVIGKQFLKQVYFRHAESNRKIFGLGIINQSGGYEVRNGLGFKGVVGSKDLSFIKGNAETGTVELFEGTFDFLTKMTLDFHAGISFPQHDYVLLHSTSLWEKAVEMINTNGYRKAVLWLDNDHAGQQAREAITEALGQGGNCVVQSMHGHYSSHDDLNAWHVKNPHSTPESLVFSFQ